jgi:hypothetical protein
MANDPGFRKQPRPSLRTTHSSNSSFPSCEIKENGQMQPCGLGNLVILPETLIQGL